MNTNVYVFGNEDVSFDSGPFAYVDRLTRDFPELHFIRVKPNEDLPFVGQESVVIFDTMYGISEMQVVTEKDMQKIQLSPRTSVHDFDLAFQLKYLLKIGKLKHIQIIGLPMDQVIDYDQVQVIFKKFVAHDIQGS